MSIQIGQKDIQATTRERIYVQSAAESNLIILRSTQPSTRILIQDYSIGQSTSNFVVAYSNLTVPLLRLNSNVGELTTDFTLTKSLQVRSNVQVVQNTTTGTLQSGPTLIANPGGGAIALNVPLFVVRNGPAPSDPELLAVTQAGRVLIPSTGAIGIGTVLALQTVHTEGAGLFRAGIFTCNIYPLDFTNRSISFGPERIDVLGDTRINGSLSIINGTFNLGQFVSAPNIAATTLLSTPQLDITSSNVSNVFVTLSYTGPMEGDSGIAHAYSNLVDVRIRPADSNIHAFTINRLGHVGIGTDRPDAILSIRDVSPIGSLAAFSNIVSFRGNTNYDYFVVDSHANVGLGTSVPMHALHVVNAEHDKPSIGLYNSVEAPQDIADGCNVPAFFYAYSNAERVVALCGDGCLTLGLGPLNHQSGYSLDVRGDAYTDCLHTQCISGIPGAAPVGRESNIDFLNSGIVGVSNLRADSAQLGNIAVENIICNYMFTSNWEILGMQCFDSNMYGLSEFHIRTSNLLFTGGQVHLDERLEDIIDLDEDPRLTGKIKVIVRDATLESSNLSRGLMVRGGNNTSILVNTSNAGQVPSYELKTTTAQAQFGMRSQPVIGDSVFIKYVGVDGLYNPAERNVAEFYSSGAVSLSTSEEFYVSPAGALGVQLNGVTPAHAVDMRGSLRVRTTATPIQPILFANTTNARVGIATETPTQTLHVQGSFYASNEALFGEKVTIGANTQAGTTGASLTVYGSNALAPPILAARTVSGNVGIGTATPLFKLDVRGDLNFNGNLYQNGSSYVSSQWTTSTLNSANIFYTAGNVGIGTTDATERLHVTGNVFSTGSFMSTSDRTYKKDLALITDPLARIAALSGYTFRRTGGANTGDADADADADSPPPTPRRETGLIAQDVATVLPEAVTVAADGTLSLAYGNLAGLFVEAFKELRSEVAGLQSKVVGLQSEVAGLRSTVAELRSELAAATTLH